MANPRKFSEKIALHNQKQAEETAAFEEIMREVMGATNRNMTLSNSNGGGQSPQQPGPPQQQQQQASTQAQAPQQQQHLHINSPFNVSRAGSLPNVNQIGQTAESNGTVAGGGGGGGTTAGIDLRSALNSLQEMKNDVRLDSIRRNTSPSNRSSPHRHSSHNISTIEAATPNVYNQNHVNQSHFSNSASKRSQSPYSMNNNAYLSPPPADNQWRRTNSDSALHQSTLISVSTNQQADGFHHHHHHHHHHQQQQQHHTQQILANHSATPQDSGNNSSRQTPATMMVDSSDAAAGELMYSNSSDNNVNMVMNWDLSPRNATSSANNNSEKFLLSASLPDQQLRPRSCEVPGINIYPSQEENNSSDGTNHHHIPISSNTGSLPDLTNLHFPVPLHAPIDSDEQNMAKMNANAGSPYSNGGGPDSPYSPASSHNSNLSPPPPCNMMNNQNQSQNYGAGNGGSSSRNQSPRRQASPGPSPSPTSSRRRAHHNANNMVMGNHRQSQTQVCCGAGNEPATTFPTPSKHVPEQDGYSQSPRDPPKITVEGLVMDTNALDLNEGGRGGAPPSAGATAAATYHDLSNISRRNPDERTPPNQYPVITNTSVAPSLFQQNHFQFTNSPNYSNFSVGAHRSTTPSDSCSAPTSPASQNISPSNSPELVAINNSNGGVPATAQQSGTNQHYAYNNSSYSSQQQQANLLQHQLEQFRMTNDANDPGVGYVMSCSPNIVSQQQAASQNSNVFYLDSLTLNQFNDSVMNASNQIGEPASFNNEIFYDSNQTLNLNMQTDYLKSEPPNSMYNSANNSPGNGNNQHHLSNSSHCTTPQTPSSIPDIILTGPNNLDETLQTNDLIKDLNNMSSFDSDIFGTQNEDMRTGSFDSFDLDSLQILQDIETNHE